MKRLLSGILFAVMVLLPSMTASAYHRVDVNLDGYVNISDVTALIDYLLGVEVGSFSVTDADISDDGNVTIIDVTLLIDYLLNGTDLNPCETETFTVNGVRFTMSFVEGGTFMMGRGQYSPSVNESPAHPVTLSSYSIGQTEVTQALWVAVMGSNPSLLQGKWGFVENLNRPVENVCWEDCQTFIEKLNELTGRTFRLPTEAEWEYAARGGMKSRNYTYSGSNVLSDVGWYCENVKTDGNYKLDPEYGHQPVATKSPNELGLYDMSGNVMEWCQNWAGRYSADGHAETNPTGPESGNARECRGGDWLIWASYCTVYCRFSFVPSQKLDRLGLRLAM